MSAGFQHVRYERDDAGVAWIIMDRPESRNAQNRRLTYELNDGFDLAAADDRVKVLVLASEGPDFSAGHDLRETSEMSDFKPVGTWQGFDLKGAEGFMGKAQELYLGMCWRWRNFPKPTIAAVQGRVIAGGLKLVWVCDLVVASEDARFCDPVVGMGVSGVDYFAHPWELGARRAKELLFTGDWFSAREAERWGMVNRVVPAGDLRREAQLLAEKIARRPSFALKLAKLSVNQTLDIQGQWTALQSAFLAAQLSHSHNQELFGKRIDPGGGSKAQAD